MLKFDSWPPEEGKVHLSENVFTGIDFRNRHRNNGGALFIRGTVIGSTIRDNVGNVRTAHNIIETIGHEALLLAGRRERITDNSRSFSALIAWQTLKSGMGHGVSESDFLQNMPPENIDQSTEVDKK